MISEDDAMKLTEQQQQPPQLIKIKPTHDEYFFLYKSTNKSEMDLQSHHTDRKEGTTPSNVSNIQENNTVTFRLIVLEEIRKSPNYAVKKYTDAIYEGEFKNGKRDGLGLMRYNNGRYYEGGWANDLRDGKGYERYSNGNSYEGDFVKGKAHGKGIYRWSNGEIYDGEWQNGLKHGDGVWKGNQGDSYIGEWRNSKAEGYGVHVWTNGILVNIYENRGSI